MQKKSDCTSSNEWWVYIVVVDVFSALGTSTFKKLQGYQVNVSMKRRLLCLYKLLCFGMWVDAVLCSSRWQPRWMIQIVFSLSAAVSQHPARRLSSSREACSR